MEGGDILRRPVAASARLAECPGARSYIFLFTANVYGAAATPEVYYLPGAHFPATGVTMFPAV